jgi:2-oxo-3-hexenedioate decarboxylase
MNPLAAQLLDAYDRKRQIPLPSAANSAFTFADAYRLTGELIALRQSRGERMVGRKIGFTNRAAWPAYGVNGPIWGAVWDSTLQMLPADAGNSVTLSLDGLMQPRLEPEIVLGLHKAPASAALADLVDAIEWVAHGFEIVQCPYADWKFTAADGIAAFGLHARLIVGPRVAVREFGATSATDFAARLSGLTLKLSCDDRSVAIGKGANVLDGPMQSLGHLVRTLAEQPELPPPGAGEIITTGTLTDAQTLAAGQRWQTQIGDAPLAGLRLSVTAAAI